MALVVDRASACRSLGVEQNALRRWGEPPREERGRVSPNSKTMTPDHLRIQALGKRIRDLEAEKRIEKGYGALAVGRLAIFTLIDQLGRRESIAKVC